MIANCCCYCHKNGDELYYWEEHSPNYTYHAQILAAKWMPVYHDHAINDVRQRSTTNGIQSSIAICVAMAAGLLPIPNAI